MKAGDNAREQLTDESAEMRQQITEWETFKAERKQAERAIQEAREYAESITATVREPLVVLGPDLRIISANHPFCQTFQVTPEEAKGVSLFDLGDRQWDIPKLRWLLEEFLPQNTILDGFEVEHKSAVIGRRVMLLNARQIYREGHQAHLTIIAIEDITERKIMEQQLITADRLASIGTLASGIAHELNNPLTSVIGFCQLLLDKDIPDDTREDLKVIHGEAQRAAQVTKNLLTFARKDTSAKDLVNINNIIESALELRAYEQKVSNIKVNTHFKPHLPEIMADCFQMQQVFLNLIINAEYFMLEAHNKGTLTIATQRTANIIRVSFTDDGPGIPEEDLGHLFDPFFTTKGSGKGTGLGLSICHGIITGHGGRIYAEGKLGTGATFVVELPINEATAIEGALK